MKTELSMDTDYIDAVTNRNTAKSYGFQVKYTCDSDSCIPQFLCELYLTGLRI